MRAYILTDKDFDRLLAEIDRNPEHGVSGRSSIILSSEEKDVYKDAHRFYNYIIHRWLSTVKEEG